jgi:hypothetical protein
VVGVEVNAPGTEVLEIETKMLELPFQLNVAADPVPVPKAKVFSVLATGVNPLSASVPAYT